MDAITDADFRSLLLQRQFLHPCGVLEDDDRLVEALEAEVSPADLPLVMGRELLVTDRRL